MSPKEKKVSDYIEWTSISYSRLRPLIILGIAALLLVGVYFVAKYGFISAGKTVDTEKLARQKKRSAKFQNLYGDVRVKPAGSANWLSAELKMQVYPGDMVSTNFNSSCRITFFDGTVYDVKPNSMIYIQESHEDSATSRKSVSVELSKGGVDLSTSETTESKSKLQTKNTVADMGPNTVAQANLSGDNAETQVKIFQGRARVATRDGKQVLDLSRGEQASVRGAKIDKLPLPPSPQLVEPQNTEILTATRPEKFTVLLRWKSPVPNLRFKVFVATDPFFNSFVHFEEIPGKEYCLLKGLPFGTYYWKVIPVNAAGLEGGSQVTSSFKIRPKASDADSKVRFDILSVDVYGATILIRGRTEPYYQLLINNKLVMVDREGKFNHYVEDFDPGAEAVILRIQLKNESGILKEFLRKIPLR